MKKMRAYGESDRRLGDLSLTVAPHTADRALSKARAREAEAKAEIGLGQLSAQRRCEILVGGTSV